MARSSLVTEFIECIMKTFFARRAFFFAKRFFYLVQSLARRRLAQMGVASAVGKLAYQQMKALSAA